MSGKDNWIIFEYLDTDFLVYMIVKIIGIRGEETRPKMGQNHLKGFPTEFFRSEKSFWTVDTYSTKLSKKLTIFFDFFQFDRAQWGIFWKWRLLREKKIFSLKIMNICMRGFSKALNSVRLIILIKNLIETQFLTS